MSSSSSVRRMEGPDGVAGKITASQPQKTLTENRQNETLGSCREAAGQEITSLSGAGVPSMCRKPAIPQQARIEKATAMDPAKGGELHGGWSTPSFPKGKKSNSSDFSRFRVLEKFRQKKSVSCSNSNGRDGKSVNCSTTTESENCKASGLDLKEKAENDSRVLKDREEQVLLVKNSQEIGGKCLNSINVSVASNTVEDCKFDLHLYGEDEKALDGIRVSRNCKEKAYFDSNLRGSCENGANGARMEESSVDTVDTDSNSTGRGKISSNGFGVSGELGQEDVSEEYEGDHVVKPNVLEVFGDSTQGEGSLSATDENQIELEFSTLLVLDKKHTDQIKSKRGRRLECAAIQEMDSDRTGMPEDKGDSEKMVTRTDDDGNGNEDGGNHDDDKEDSEKMVTGSDDDGDEDDDGDNGDGDNDGNDNDDDEDDNDEDDDKEDSEKMATVSDDDDDGYNGDGDHDKNGNDDDEEDADDDKEDSEKMVTGTNEDEDEDEDEDDDDDNDKEDLEKMVMGTDDDDDDDDEEEEEDNNDKEEGEEEEEDEDDDDADDGGDNGDGDDDGNDNDDDNDEDDDKEDSEKMATVSDDDDDGYNGDGDRDNNGNDDDDEDADDDKEDLEKMVTGTNEDEAEDDDDDNDKEDLEKMVMGTDDDDDDDDDEEEEEEEEEDNDKEEGGEEEEDEDDDDAVELMDLDDQEPRPKMMRIEETYDYLASRLCKVGNKYCTGGWLVDAGEHALLAHDDNTCSYQDLTNSMEKCEFKPPPFQRQVPHSLWGDCWLTSATDTDGCTVKYVVAASAGNFLYSGFCSWDFCTGDVRAFRFEDDSLPINAAPIASRNRHWWYKPSGNFIASTATCQKVVSIYDIRDGRHLMKWEVGSPVLNMHYSSPLKWRSGRQVVIAEIEAITLWDVESRNAQPLRSTPTFGKKVSAFYFNSEEAEFGCGVRQRVFPIGADGMFCTAETINVLDFRLSSGVALKIAKQGVTCHSIYSHRDSIFLGCTHEWSAARKHSPSLVQHFSLRTGRIVGTCPLPDTDSHFDHSIITQVWGDSNIVMVACRLGLFVFDIVRGNAVREIIGPNDMFRPTFDHWRSRTLLISRDRPALWRYRPLHL